jgi:hypothetical protein
VTTEHRPRCRHCHSASLTRKQLTLGPHKSSRGPHGHGRCLSILPIPRTLQVKHCRQPSRWPAAATRQPDSDSGHSSGRSEEQSAIAPTLHWRPRQGAGCDQHAASLPEARRRPLWRCNPADSDPAGHILHRAGWPAPTRKGLEPVAGTRAAGPSEGPRLHRAGLRAGSGRIVFPARPETHDSDSGPDARLRAEHCSQRSA